MPLTIKSAVINYKDPDTGDYVEVNAVGDTAHVTDVQINGTSVVTDNVANIPIASEGNKYGLTRYDMTDNGYYGVTVNSNGVVRTAIPTNAQIKGGNTSYKPISPTIQHQATFYGLAKAAGADMASLSSVTIGEYPDEQKIAIQKMLGIYEAPWELIREDTFTNAEQAEHIISADGDGNAFELTDLVLQVTIPKDVAVNVGSYGIVEFYYTSTQYYGAMLNAVTGTKTNAWYGTVQVQRDKNASFIRWTSFSESGNNRALLVKNLDDIVFDRTFSKIRFRSYQGTFSYKLYGKRKWE